MGTTISAADLTNCRYNATFEYAECAESAADSLYMGPNVPTNRYDLCEAGWIGDGICDDSCYVEDCSWDGGDCDPGHGCASGGICSTMWLAWSYYAGDDVKLNTSYVCGTMWPSLQLILGVGVDENESRTCEEIFTDDDFNKDSMINFREVVPIGYSIQQGDERRGLQVNCSDCCG